jgi:hypothetical protein
MLAGTPNKSQAGDLLLLSDLLLERFCNPCRFVLLLVGHLLGSVLDLLLFCTEALPNLFTWTWFPMSPMLVRMHHKVTHSPSTSPDNTRKCLSTPPLGSSYITSTSHGIVHQLDGGEKKQ